MYKTGEFNKFGAVTDTETQAHGKAHLEAGASINEAAGAAATSASENVTPAEPEASDISTDADETASDSELVEEGEQGEQVDADGDGHDDNNGQFVDGNQEAAASEVGEEA